ncbi:MAG: DUF3822 family protein [Bacteroidia bacterium]|nr:DUF3822 family protein [Bacteroidia bacterium]NNF31285.1 DUF3822 family protein [Flavobacteriaceae bacterium]MBT8274623.1 DUF3822 family protein [Bacteroidia bacterium]NNJ83035.1 DUF3822 family protein [Flavobacteriaceae bacterium]NNK54207.1 DUF3822 family protein [Flavobacteriaceae bacterium]
MTQTTTSSLHTIPNKRLSVQVALTGLSFLVTNSAKTEVLHFSAKEFEKARTPEELLIDVEAFVNAEIEDPTLFESVTVLYSNAEYTAVPSALFDETKASDYLKFNSKILANDFIAWDELAERNMHLVYVPYVNINNYLFDTFGSFQYFHTTSVLLNTLPVGTKFSEEPTVHIHVEKTNFQIIVQASGELKLCNSYHFVTPEDFIYYILFCFEQLQINPDTVKLVLLGNINREDELYSMVYTYIRNVELMEDDLSKLNIENTFAHQYMLLKSV